MRLLSRLALANNLVRVLPSDMPSLSLQMLLLGSYPLVNRCRQRNPRASGYLPLEEVMKLRRLAWWQAQRLLRDPTAKRVEKPPFLDSESLEALFLVADDANPCAPVLLDSELLDREKSRGRNCVLGSANAS